ncbi:hypothetical protein NX059_011193 [Plenodomus lindquistii]|nr:hypothetical protein NX059_011193 [Plenodomus lindquistii]
MPLFTPSRLAVIVVSFSLITFFWTFGLPRPLAAPALPIINHYNHKNGHTAATTPTPGAHATGQENAAPAATSVPDFGEDGGRWGDSVNGTEPTDEADTMPAKETTQPYKEDAQPPTHAVADYCKDVKGAQHVMVVIRTSKSEMEARLPTHLKNLLECVPNFAIFSDHSTQFQGYKVHNALESISGDTKRNHDEFHEYQLMHADAQHKPDSSKTKDLDKWKFLPMVYQAYHQRPSARFILFIEADTSLSWTNFLQWVGRLDYRIPYHSGAPTFMGGVQISQRGPGILLSQAALRQYVHSYDQHYQMKWEPRIPKECCGDLLLSMALNDAHVELYPSWPMLQGEKPSTLDFTHKIWCSPAVSWHRLVGDELGGMWENEKRWVEARGWEEPYLYRDAFHDHVESHMQAHKDDWDNLSQDTKIVAPQGRQQEKKEEEERKKKHEEGKKAQAEKDEKTAKDSSKSEEMGTATSTPTSESKASTGTDTTHTQSKPTLKPKSTTPDPKTKRNDEPPTAKPNWDKLSETFADAADSADRCQKACIEVPDCLQWRYTTLGDGECHLGKVLRLGKKTDGGDAKWTSGWLADRVGKVTKEWGCKKAEWKFYQ